MLLFFEYNILNGGGFRKEREILLNIPVLFISKQAKIGSGYIHHSKVESMKRFTRKKIQHNLFHCNVVKFH